MENKYSVLRSALPPVGFPSPSPVEQLLNLVLLCLVWELPRACQEEVRNYGYGLQHLCSHLEKWIVPWASNTNKSIKTLVAWYLMKKLSAREQTLGTARTKTAEKLL